jgi:hypothetical protein
MEFRPKKKEREKEFKRGRETEGHIL